MASISASGGNRSGLSPCPLRRLFTRQWDGALSRRTIRTYGIGSKSSIRRIVRRKGGRIYSSGRGRAPETLPPASYTVIEFTISSDRWISLSICDGTPYNNDMGSIVRLVPVLTFVLALGVQLSGLSCLSEWNIITATSISADSSAMSDDCPCHATFVSSAKSVISPNTRIVWHVSFHVPSYTYGASFSLFRPPVLA